MIDTDQLAQDHYGEFPHPLEPSLKVKDFPVAVQLATATKFGGADPGDGHASPKEAALFWNEFKGTGLSPDAYLQLLHQMAPLSFRYHGRAPTMREITMHAEAKPKEMRDYFGNLPSEHYPEMTAHEYVQGHTKASWYARKHMGRDAYPHEVALFHAGGYALQHIDGHYQELADHKQRNDVQAGRQQNP